VCLLCPAPDTRQYLLVLIFKHCGQKFILAVEMVVERALRNSRGRRNRIDPGTRETSFIKQFVSSFDDVLSSRVLSFPHCSRQNMYTD